MPGRIEQNDRISFMADLVVIGGGLAGCEAAWQAAQLGLSVDLYEMRPSVVTEAHQTGELAEIVCSNSLGSFQTDRPSGLLKQELRICHSLLLACAEKAALPAGTALAVDRTLFSKFVTESIEGHKNIRVIRKEVKEIPEQLSVIASGPLTSPNLSQFITQFFGEESLFFYDAISPIVSAESIDFNFAFRASRFNRDQQEDGDYINCPMDENQYKQFVHEIINAKQIPLQGFEEGISKGVSAGSKQFFEGCLPIEVMARRGELALAYGPLRPIGLRDPHTGQRPYAVVQLRRDNLAGSLYNMVGFQTNLTFSEQNRIFHLIPGLEHAEFVRFGQMHRNSFICSPKLLRSSMQTKIRDNLFFAGQIAGVEGYLGNVATGLVAGINAARIHSKIDPIVFPKTTMIGALCHYVTNADIDNFQPMKANFGILPSLDHPIRSKHDRNQEFARLSLESLNTFLQEIN
jgi:methylenetetrahydrofolate--tRNA-(uracil-5-)-methyltransferase